MTPDGCHPQTHSAVSTLLRAWHTVDLAYVLSGKKRGRSH